MNPGVFAILFLVCLGFWGISFGLLIALIVTAIVPDGQINGHLIGLDSVLFICAIITTGILNEAD